MGHYPNLNPEKALIWRIVHKACVPWLLDNGIQSRNSQLKDPQYVNIGNAELIDKRAHREVPIGPRGTLSDYVPFYFTPFSPMLYNIKTGYGGITKRSNEEIVIMVSSLHHVKSLGLRFVFTDRHAYPRLAQYFDDLKDLSRIDWELLQKRDFKRDPEDPEKVERYQAEALVHDHLPIAGLLGLVCYDKETAQKLEELVSHKNLALKVHQLAKWYF